MAGVNYTFYLESKVLRILLVVLPYGATSQAIRSTSAHEIILIFN